MDSLPVTFTDPTWLEEERRCLAALRRGERAAFHRLYEVMAPPLFARILLPRLGDARAAQDVVADTFQTVLERLDAYQDSGDSVWSWLVTIASNRAHDLQRQRARVGRPLVGFESLLAALADDAATPSDEMVDAERLRSSVADTLDQLNPRYRRALELRFLEQRPRTECATALEVGPETFDVLLLRALRAFRAQWLDSFGAAT